MSEKNMIFIKCILLTTTLTNIATSDHSTKLVKKNIFLSRKKRYLAFPEKSNLVMTMSFAKPLMRPQPKGHNVVGECDVPFPLPSDTRWFKKFKNNHYINKREIIDGLETAFMRYGLNGSACVKRMICEANQYIDIGGKSLVRDFISAIFIDSEVDFKSLCNKDTFQKCPFSFLQYILGTMRIVPRY